MAVWKKADLLTDIGIMYIGVGTPENPSNEGPVNGVIKYIVNVNETGYSQANEKPTGYRKNVTFYVYNEGQGDEQAWYELNEPTNQSNTNVTATDSSWYSYTRIFNSAELRQRVLGDLISKSIYLITAGTPTQSVHWAQSFLQIPAKYMDAFMICVANNGDVRAAGNKVTDVLLDFCISAAIPTVATAFAIS
jgi:hypothetical protein